MSFRVNGVEIAPGGTRFEPNAGSPPANTNFRVNGVDIAGNFEGIASGSSANNNTGFRVNGVDLDDLIANYGSVSSSPTVQLSNRSVYGADISSPYYAEARYTIETDGDITNKVNAITTDFADWVSDKVGLVSSDFEYNCVKLSGTTPGGTAVHANSSTYTPITSNLSWYFATATAASRTCQLQLTIREIADTSNTATCVITLTIEAGPIS